MSLIEAFEKECAAAKVAPTAALKKGGVHPTLWKRWREGTVSPTIRNFEKAQMGLKALQAGSQQAA